MVPESHDIEFTSSDELRKFLTSDEFMLDTVAKLRDQYVVEVAVQEPKKEKQDELEVTVERLHLSYTRNNAGGLKDAIDFLLMPLMARNLDQATVKGAIPRPKSDSFEDNMPYFESKLLQRAEPPLATESPTRGNFPDDGSARSIFDKLRKPGSMSSFTSFMERRRKNGSNSPASLFMQASSNASKASLVSMESRDSGYRNPWNDSGIDLEHDQQNGHTHTNSWASFAPSSRPNTSSNSLSGAFETKFPFGVNGNGSTTSLSTPVIPGLGLVAKEKGTATGTAGDVTPTEYSAQKDGLSLTWSNSSQQPISRPTSTKAMATASATANNTNNDQTNVSASTTSGYPAPIGPPH